MIHLTMLIQSSSNATTLAPILLPVDRIQAITPVDFAQPDGPSLVCLTKETYFASTWHRVITVADSIAAIEVALERAGFDVARPDTPEPRLGRVGLGD